MRDTQKVAELESALFVSTLALAAMANKVDVFNRENAHLRVVAQNVACPYGRRASNGACLSGYPGCACADDLIALAGFYSEDPEAHDALQRLAAKNTIVELRLINAIARVREAQRQFLSMSEGFGRIGEKAKAAALAGLADMMADPL
jgi:hypothetical protein